MKLYANKMDKLEEMDKFFERYNQPSKTEPGRNRKYEQTNHKSEGFPGSSAGK